MVALTLDQTAPVAKLLPFWGRRQPLEGSLGDSISTPHAVEVALSYGAVLLALTFMIASRRLRVAPHASSAVAPYIRG